MRACVRSFARELPIVEFAQTQCRLSAALDVCASVRELVIENNN